MTGHAAARSRRRLVVPLVVVALALGGTAAYRVLLAGDETPTSGEPTVREVPEAPFGTPSTGRLVESRIEENGDVVVSEWIRTTVPIDRLELTTADPDLRPGTVEAARVVVTDADGTLLARRSSVGTKVQVVTLRTPATDLYLSYTVTGATLDEQEASVSGRAVARVLGMDVDHAAEEGPTIRLVRAPGTVLSAGCLPRDAGFQSPPAPCGAETPERGWQVVLRGDDRDERLLVSYETASAP